MCSHRCMYVCEREADKCWHDMHMNERQKKKKRIAPHFVYSHTLATVDTPVHKSTLAHGRQSACDSLAQLASHALTCPPCFRQCSVHGVAFYKVQPLLNDGPALCRHERFRSRRSGGRRLDGGLATHSQSATAHGHRPNNNENATNALGIANSNK